MTDPALIEAAARAIMTANEWSSFWDEHDAEQLAKAVITAIAPRIESEALEKAAKVARDKTEWGKGMLEGSGVGAVHVGACNDIEAEILALIPATPAKEPE